MKTKTLENILAEISEDPLLAKINGQLSEEEKKKVDSIVSNFARNFILPLEDLVRKATEDPEVKKEIRTILESKGNEGPDESDR